RTTRGRSSPRTGGPNWTRWAPSGYSWWIERSGRARARWRPGPSLRTSAHRSTGSHPTDSARAARTGPGRAGTPDSAGPRVRGLPRARGPAHVTCVTARCEWSEVPVLVLGGDGLAHDVGAAGAREEVV